MSVAVAPCAKFDANDPIPFLTTLTVSELRARRSQVEPDDFLSLMWIAARKVLRWYRPKPGRRTVEWALQQYCPKKAWREFRKEKSKHRPIDPALLASLVVGSDVCGDRV